MEPPGVRTRTALLLGGLALLALLALLGLVALLATGVWLTRDEAPAASAPLVAGDPGAAPARAATGTEGEALPGAPPRIPESGRLVLDADALPAGGKLTLGLDLPDAARGDGPRPVVIVSTDSRRLETTADVPPGAGSGVRLEIDAAWLRPGRYMISVTTAESSHFPVRRYVLEIR